jgi:hypothetical protein
MAQRPDGSRTTEEVRRDIDTQRAELAEAVDTLRQATDITPKLREKLPIVAGGALAAGFFLAGGFGATMRLLARRGREGHEKARLGRFSVVDRD